MAGCGRGRVITHPTSDSFARRKLTDKANRWHPQRKREIMGLMAVAATVRKDRIPRDGYTPFAARSRQPGPQ
jgi:hypothetical protein